MKQKSTVHRRRPSAAVADRLHSAAIHLLRRLRRVDQASGLSAPKLSALSVIVYAGPIAIGDLASAEQVRAPTITRLVKELEADGLIQRVGDRADRRVSRVRATPSGVRLLNEGRARRVERLEQFVATLSERDLQRLEQAVTIVERFTKPASPIVTR